MKIRSNLISHSFVVLLFVTFCLENLYSTEDRNRAPKIDGECRHLNHSVLSSIGSGAVFIFPLDSLPTSIRWISFDQEVGTLPIIVRAKKTREKRSIFSAFPHIVDSLTTSHLIVSSLFRRVDVANTLQINPLFSIDLLSNYSLASFSHRLTAARL